MRKCTGNNTQDWGFDAIFDVKCPNCGNLVEFFKDEINRNCPQCKESVLNDRKDYGCDIIFDCPHAFAFVKSNLEN
jgi:endogenous inhibitor of DNA gyrase (YacG/DUF329 family)